MRLSITVLVAIQASMGLAHAIPFSPSEYTEEGKKRETLRDFYKKHKIDASLRLPDPETDKYGPKGHRGNYKVKLKQYFPHDHESDHGYSIEEKYEPEEGHTITKVKVRKNYAHEHYEHEGDYDHKDKHDDLEEDHGYNDYRFENHHYKHKKDYETKKFDAFNDHYGLSEHDFDKYFTKDHHDPSEEYEPQESHDSNGNNYKRWPPRDPHYSWWHPRPFSNFHTRLQEFDPNAEHSHSYKAAEKPGYPEPPPLDEKYSPKDVHDFSRGRESDMDIFKPGYHAPEKYEAEVQDEKLAHFSKYEQENDNLPYFEKYPKEAMPTHPFEEKKTTIPKAEYDGEDEQYHTMDPEDWHHNREIHKKPDYDKEDHDEYHDDEEDYSKHDPSPKGPDEYGMKGINRFNYEYHPDEKSFLSDEAFEKLRQGGSDQPESYSYEKYFPREGEEKKYPNEAAKYGYRKYDEKEDDKKHSHSNEKSHRPEEEEEYDDNAKYSKEDKNHESRQLYYPSHHESTESAEYYRKQEVGHGGHNSNKQPYARMKDEHHGYYKEPGYENVVPGFMWAGPGTVTKTPCAKKEGCPHGHWHMLEPKNGEHRRIGITGTNIAIEPDYTRPDYKEDTVNHVLPGYENVIPGFEWAGVGVVTEVPCRSAADCPKGGWFMLAPKLGEHRRIAMNYPKATAIPHPHQTHWPTVQVHKSDYKARSPVGHEGLVYEKEHEEFDGNEREYKLIHRHSRDLTKRTIEARAPCKKKPPKEEEEAKEVKKVDPNKPLPRLNTVHLLNIEKLSDEKRQAVVAAFPMMDDDFKKEFLTFQELTPEFITKLNELYAILLERPEGKKIIEFISRRPRYVPSSKRSIPELSEKEIERIEELSPALRQVVAKKLDFDPKLTLELAKADELSDDLIGKLNKEYARVVSDPKYAKVIEKFMPKSNSKRAEPELTKEMLSKIEGLSPAMREIVAKKLDFDPELSVELANADKLSDDLIKKLNKEYARVVSDPKYSKIIEKFASKSKSKSKRAEPELTDEMISKVEGMRPSMRMMAAQKLDMDPELTTEMANADKFTPELIEKLNKEYARIVKDPKYKSLLDKIGFKQKRADETPELSKEQLAKIEEMSPAIRLMAAKRLGMDASLSTELANADKFTPELIKKLNKEYVRIYNDPKYKDVIAKFVSKSKRRFTRYLTDQQLDMISNLRKSERQFIAEKLNFEKELADEFVNSETFTPHVVKKLNEVYNQIYGGHKYNELVDRFSTHIKRQVASDPKKEEEEDKQDIKELKDLTKKIREQITKDLNFDVDLDGEFLYAKRITESLIEKLVDLARDTIVELEWEEIVEDLLEEDETLEEKETSHAQKATVNIESQPSANSTKTPEVQSVSIGNTSVAQSNQTANAQNSTSSAESRLENDQDTTKISMEQPTNNDNERRSDLDEKLEESKKNGWCNEFLGTLKDTWDDSVDEALSKTEEKDD
ncbi:hypothetical protein FLAG1_04104 [Fusarium langsethiae]|uniref:Uncharacterized protein n=1 Tax=Fusarium langsethiae TaxID=179993 RepID=A0A0M9EZF1_FUSLA|nr:hypothetical protein FLAG1_04104 [Fusarium langsethiae]GKU02488.1 unnamed protein product [Fusarium langsethiae]GKU15224.1 unnamed protein product [Fusarium langsethiae]